MARPTRAKAPAAIRYLLDGEVRTVSGIHPDPHGPAASARGSRPHRHEGGLRGGRLRRLHRRPRRARRATGALSRDQLVHPVRPDPRRPGAPHRREPEGPRGPARSTRCSGDGRRPRLAVRLLHAGLRDVAVRALQVEQRARTAPKSTTRSPATSAAAPATGRSSTPRRRCTRSAVPSRRRNRTGSAPSPVRAPRPAAKSEAGLAAKLRALKRRRGLVAFARERHVPFAAQPPTSSRRCASACRRHASSPAAPTSASGSPSSTARSATSSTSATSPICSTSTVARRPRSTSAPRCRSPTRSRRSSSTTPSCARCSGASRRPPIRNAGTLGGNVANGSPIGDSMPPLIALGARVVLRKGCARRELPLEASLSRLPEDGAAAGRVRRAGASAAAGRRRCSSRPTRSRNASTRTFRRSARRSRSLVEGGDDPRRPRRVRRRGRDPEARGPAARLRSPARPWNEATCERRGGGARQRLSRRSPTCAPPPAYRSTVAQNLLRKFYLETAGRTRRGSEPAVRSRRGPRMNDPRPPRARGRRPRRRRRSVRHDSAHLHVAGEAAYIDDILEARGTLHAALGLSRRAHAPIKSMDLAAVRAAPGVVAVLTAADIPGENNVGPILHDDPILAADEVQFVGQPVFLVVAAVGRRGAPGRAARRDRVRGPAGDPHDRGRARSSSRSSFPPVTLQRGDWQAALAAAPHRLKGAFRIGGQEQFYLEGQVAYAVPKEDGDMLVYSSTQHPGEVQHQVAHALGVDGAPRRRRVPAHGRRLRRQGNAAGASRRAPQRWRARATGTPGQAALRPRRRHARHRQAPRLPRRVRRRLRRRRAHPRPSTSCSPRAAASRPT